MRGGTYDNPRNITQDGQEDVDPEISVTARKKERISSVMREVIAGGTVGLGERGLTSLVRGIPEDEVNVDREKKSGVGMG